MKITSKAQTKRSLIDYEVYEINPEPVKDMQWVYKGASEKNMMATLESGKVVNLTILDKSKFFLVDKSNFTKVIITDLLSWSRDLSYAGYRMLMYILSNLGVNDDRVRISIVECRELFDLKSNTMIYQGLENLLSNRFLFRSKEGSMVYFINRNKIYNGDRVKEANKDFDNLEWYKKKGIDMPKFDEIMQSKKNYSKAIKNVNNRKRVF